MLFARSSLTCCKRIKKLLNKVFKEKYSMDFHLFSATKESSRTFLVSCYGHVSLVFPSFFTSNFLFSLFSCVRMRENGGGHMTPEALQQPIRAGVGASRLSRPRGQTQARIFPQNYFLFSLLPRKKRGRNRVRNKRVMTGRGGRGVE